MYRGKNNSSAECYLAGNVDYRQIPGILIAIMLKALFAFLAEDHANWERSRKHEPSIFPDQPLATRQESQRSSFGDKGSWIFRHSTPDTLTPWNGFAKPESKKKNQAPRHENCSSLTTSKEKMQSAQEILSYLYCNEAEI